MAKTAGYGLRRLSLTIDYAFKKFFVTSPDLLIDFLNALFQQFDNFQIESLSIENPELPGEAIEDKNAILDILAKDSLGRSINVEMQAHEIAQFAKRSAFYAFRLYIRGIEKGDNHADIPPVFSVNLLDFDLFPGVNYHRRFRLLDVQEPGIAMMDDIEFHFIELKKIRTSFAKLRDPLEIWSAFIEYSDSLSEEDMKKLEEKKPILKKAHETLDEISQDSETRLAYDRRKSAIFFYEKTLDQKFSEGKIEGIQEGKLEDAQHMLEKGYPVADVIEITGLTMPDLQRAGLIEK